MKREKIVDPWNIPRRRADLKETEFTTEQKEKPIIGVLNSWVKTAQRQDTLTAWQRR